MIVPYQPVRKVLTSDFTDIMLKQAQKDPKENKDAIIFKAFGPLGLACPANVFPPPGTSASVPLPPNIEWDSAFFSVSYKQLKIQQYSSNNYRGLVSTLTASY